MTQSNVSSDHFVEVLDVVEDDRIQLARRQAEGQATVAHRQSVSGALARPVGEMGATGSLTGDHPGWHGIRVLTIRRLLNRGGCRPLLMPKGRRSWRSGVAAR